MSKADPTPEFWLLVREIESGNIQNPQAVAFVDGAFEAVDAINRTIASMLENGCEAPTPRPEQALANLQRGACIWLGRVPTEQECNAEMKRHRKRKNASARSAVRRTKRFPKY